MSRTTISQIEAIVTAQGLALNTQDEAIVALSHQLARIERQLATLQLSQQRELPLVPTYDPCKHMTNQEFRLAYAQYRAVTNKAPTADAVRAWVRAGRPGL